MKNLSYWLKIIYRFCSGWYIICELFVSWNIKRFYTITICNLAIILNLPIAILSRVQGYNVMIKSYYWFIDLITRALLDIEQRVVVRIPRQLFTQLCNCIFLTKEISKRENSEEMIKSVSMLLLFDPTKKQIPRITSLF